MSVGELGKHPADVAELTEHQQPASSRASGARSAATRCAWPRASPTSRRAHRASRPATRGSASMASRTRAMTNSGVPGVGEHGQHQVFGLRVEHLRHGAVEIGRDAVADVSLHQAFQPVRWRGPGVEGVDGGDERLHDVLRIGGQLLDPAAQQLEMPELGHRHLGQRGLVGQARSPAPRRRRAGRTRSARRKRAARASRARRRQGPCPAGSCVSSHAQRNNQARRAAWTRRTSARGRLARLW